MQSRTMDWELTLVQSWRLSDVSCRQETASCTSDLSCTRDDLSTLAPPELKANREFCALQHVQFAEAGQSLAQPLQARIRDVLHAVQVQRLQLRQLVQR